MVFNPPGLRLSKFWPIVLIVWNVTRFYGLGIGVTSGLGLSIYDWFRNRLETKQPTKLHLISNLFWCGLYALIINIVNLAFFYALYVVMGVNLFAWFLSLSLAFLNLAAILWAAIRSITTNDVLTPRVLREKLRRQTRPLE